MISIACTVAAFDGMSVAVVVGNILVDLEMVAFVER
jgi:hypothetical protein